MQVVYTANNYQKSNAANQNFVLALDEQSCGIAIHTAEGQLQYLAHYNFVEPLVDNESIFFDFVRSQDILREKFKTAYIALNASKGTLIPNSIYNDLYTDAYLRNLYTVEKPEIVKANEVVKDEAHMVFCASEHLYYPARSKYYDAIIEPVSANYLRKSIKYHHNKLNVFLEDTTLYLIHGLNKKPVFFNSFEYNGVDEAAYYILNYYEVFNISHQSLPIVLHGNVHPQLKEMLSTYSGKNEEAEPINKNIEVSKDFKFSFLIDYTY